MNGFENLLSEVGDKYEVREVMRIREELVRRL